MKVLLFFAFVALASAGSHDFSTIAKRFLPRIRYLYRAKPVCRVRVIPYPLSGMRFQQANDKTSYNARSYYNHFSIQNYPAQNSAQVSQFQVAIGYKKPTQELSSKKVKINFYNLLFTASLRVSKKGNCRGSQSSLLGFVELVKTDTTWYRDTKGIIQLRGKNLAEYDYLQYVMTKLIPNSNRMFANDTTWGRDIVIPLGIDYIVPLKYESVENIEVDFEKHPSTTKYEKLIEKKILIVQANTNNEVVKVIAGVDVMMYLSYETTAITNVPHLRLTTNHGLIQQIANPEKYVSVLTSLQRQGRDSVRDMKLTRKEWFSATSSGDTTLNPFPESIHIYTA